MSLFAMGYNSLEVNEAKLTMAELELDSLTSMFNNMLKTCRSKCIIPRYGEEELSKGEMVCIDRCVSKFFKTNLAVGDYLRASGNGPDSLASFRSVAAAAGTTGISGTGLEYGDENGQ